MTYTEYLKSHKLQKPDFKTFDIVIIDAPIFGFGPNGYVVIPDEMPLNYYSDYYKFLDDSTVGGLTFSGYLFITDGETAVDILDSDDFNGLRKFSEEDKKSINEFKKHSLRVIGFDNQHYRPNEMNAVDGANYLAKQLKQHYLEESK